MSDEGKIYKQISLVMSEIGAIGKDRKNVEQKYSFRGIDDIYNAVNAALAKHEVFCAPFVEDLKREERQSKSGGVLNYTILTIKYTFYTVDGSSVEARTIGEAMDSGDKSCNKAMSAAQKYAFLQVFCIPTEEPKDTEEETHNPLPKAKLPFDPSTTQGQEQHGLYKAGSASTGEKTQNFEFLKAMAKQKERVGDSAYYKILGGNGFEHANEITDRTSQETIFKILLGLPDKKEA